MIYTTFHSFKGAITVRDQLVLRVHNTETWPCAITRVLIFNGIGRVENHP